MSRRSDSPARSRPWIEWVAGRIEDPLTRLRFLRSTAHLHVPKRRPRRFLRVALTLAALMAVFVPFFVARAVARVKPAGAPPMVRVPTRAEPAQGPPDIWQVEKTGGSELYSNGLRVDTEFAVGTRPRSYVAFPAGWADSSAGQHRSAAAGIVFHTTESLQAPFEAGENRVLKQAGESLVEYVRRRHAYNYLIDRFGRVYRIVAESDAANHAGFSVWSDTEWLYVNLNDSFLGVSFEAKTEPGQTDSSISPAQVRAAAMLTEMLRSHYGIPARNCVTHAQVSVNPANMLVGYHTDWASSFPFEQMGLPDNYSQPLPALAAFGFEYDSDFVHSAGARMHAGVVLAEEALARRAAQTGLTLPALRKLLQKRYRDRLAEQRRCVPATVGQGASEDGDAVAAGHPLG